MPSCVLLKTLFSNKTREFLLSYINMYMQGFSMDPEATESWQVMATVSVADLGLSIVFILSFLVTCSAFIATILDYGQQCITG